MMWISLLKMWWKPILGVAVVGFFYWKVTSFWDEYKEMKDGYESQITQLITERNDARVEAESAKSALAEKARNEERLELLLADAITRQDDIRKEKKEQQEVFEGHDLGEMARRHNRWIEKLANKATQERMDEFEAALNR